MPIFYNTFCEFKDKYKVASTQKSLTNQKIDLVKLVNKINYLIVELCVWLSK